MHMLIWSYTVHKWPLLTSRTRGGWVTNILRRLLYRTDMEQLYVYSGHGMYEKDTTILLRALKQHACPIAYRVSSVSPEDIKDGKLQNNVALLAIGGGFDLGLIEALGADGMREIREFVSKGGHYLGICSGAYFATDFIEFDKGGSLQVCGERFLKFYPGCGVGPLYKPYDYRNRKGAVAALINFPCEGRQTNGSCNGTPKSTDCKKVEQNGYQNDKLVTKAATMFKVFFNGGGCFVDKDMNMYLEERKSVEQGTGDSDKCHWLNNAVASQIVSSSNVEGEAMVEPFNGRVQVLSRFQDLPSQPVAMVKCNVGKGSAILSGVHFEYDAADIDDEDRTAEHIIPDLQQSAKHRRELFCSVLTLLGIVCK